jgi:2'-5' RNA ligase
MHEDLPRLFIAVPIDEQLRDQLTIQCNQLKTKLPFQKWTDPADYHITLKFLGETKIDQIQAMHKLLAVIAQTTDPFELSEKEWGTFGPQTAPTILWAGIGGDVLALKALQQRVDESMATLGFVQETRSFNPHLTIARRYKGKGPLNLTTKDYLPEAPGHSIHWTVNELKLYQSHIQKRPMYEAIASFELLEK